MTARRLFNNARYYTPHAILTGTLRKPSVRRVRRLCGGLEGVRMRTIEDLRKELDATAAKPFAHLTPFQVPAFTPAQRLRLDEIDPAYLAALEHCRFQEIPLSRRGANRLLMLLDLAARAEVAA